MKITRKRRHEAMLEQGMHSGNTDAKFDPPPEPKARAMTHRDSDVLGRYVGTPAAPVQGEEAKAGEHTALPWTPAKFHWMGRACDDLSRDELMDIIQYLHRQLEATREESHRSIDFILSARKAREQ